MTPAARVLLSPAWLLRSALALIGVALCVLLSWWQYQRTQDQIAVAEAAVAQLQPFEAAVPADAAGLDAGLLGRHVLVTGQVVPGARSYIRSRLSSDDEVGYLVVDGVRLADGRVVAVLQGWVPDPDSAPQLAGRTVTVTGRIQPYENFYPGAPVSAEEPLVTITAAGLDTQWPADTPGAGYVAVTGTPAATGFGPVTPLVGTDPDVPFPVQNIFYTVQWLIFAGVIVVIWGRFLREDIRAARAVESEARG